MPHRALPPVTPHKHELPRRKGSTSIHADVPAATHHHPSAARPSGRPRGSGRPRRRAAATHTVTSAAQGGLRLRRAARARKAPCAAPIRGGRSGPQLSRATPLRAARLYLERSHHRRHASGPAGRCRVVTPAGIGQPLRRWPCPLGLAARRVASPLTQLGSGSPALAPPLRRGMVAPRARGLLPKLPASPSPSAPSRANRFEPWPCH